MAKRKRITPLQRARQAASRVNALQAVSGYERKMAGKREASVKAALRELQRRGVPPQRWAEEVEYSEPWMLPLVTDIYRTDGMLSATEVANRMLSRKADVTDIFARAIMEWCASNLGDRIVLMGQTVARWLQATLAAIYAGETLVSIAGEWVSVPVSTLGIEAITKLLYRETLARYDEIKRWQVRRIVQTEAMKSMNIGGRVAVEALGIAYEKTWSIAGINTRETHEAVDGVTIPGEEMFTVGGFPMQEPMDERFGAPASEIINCSCTAIYLPSDNGLTEL